MKQTQRIQKTLVLASDDSTELYDMEFRTLDYKNIHWNLYFISEWFHTTEPTLTLNRLLEKADAILVKPTPSELRNQSFYESSVPLYTIPKDFLTGVPKGLSALVPILDYFSGKV